jgi:hypothetical protein
MAVLTVGWLAVDEIMQCSDGREIWEEFVVGGDEAWDDDVRCGGPVFPSSPGLNGAIPRPPASGCQA